MIRPLVDERRRLGGKIQCIRDAVRALVLQRVFNRVQRDISHPELPHPVRTG